MFNLSQLCFEVTDVLVLVGIERKVANGSNKNVDTTGNGTPNKVTPGSALPTSGLEGAVVDDETTDGAKEESQQETNNVIVHKNEPPKCNW